MTLSAAVLAEIKRKSEKGISLTNVTAESKAAYRKFEAEANAKAAKTKANPSVVGSGTTSTPAYNPAATATNSTVSGRVKREAEKAKFTGWDNDPAVRSLQEQSWGIYIDTGKWNTAEQKELHALAEKTRMYNNPMYGGSKMGPADWVDAEKIMPRDTTPGANTLEGGLDGVLNPDKFGSYAKAGVGLVFVMFILSMFRK